VRKREGERKRREENDCKGEKKRRVVEKRYTVREGRSKSERIEREAEGERERARGVRVREEWQKKR